MSIWIRSQNKHHLCECMNISISYDCDDGYGIDGEPGPFEALGTYPTAEEAERVLDMIEQRIMHIDDCRRTGDYRDWIDPVFHMPPAGFSQEPEKFYPDTERQGVGFQQFCGGDFCYLVDCSQENPQYPNDDVAVPGCPHLDDCKAAWDRGCR